MKIYQVCAHITDTIRGDKFHRGFEYFKEYNKAVERKQDLKTDWNKYKHCQTAFYIDEIYVIE